MPINIDEVKRRLLLLLNDTNMVNQYIRQYGPRIDIKNIKAVKENANKFFGEDPNQKGDDPIYTINVSCPVCNKENIECYEQRAKSQQILQNKFLVPIYRGAFGFKTVDYTMLGVTVCPRCLFASPDKKDFNRPSEGLLSGANKNRINSNIILTLQEKIGERKAMMKFVTDYQSYFKRPRNAEAAIMSYKLAMHRAAVEAEYEQPFSYYKQGAYALRIAKILKDQGAENLQILKEALEYFEEAFKTSNCPSEEIEMQVLYTIVALNLKLKDQRKANSYLSVFSNLKNSRIAEMKQNPAVNTIAIEKWEEKAKRLWEDRDIPDLFKEE